MSSLLDVRGDKSEGRRAVALLVGVGIFLACVFDSARTFFNSAGDLALYQHYGAQFLEPGHQLPHEYPPLSVFIFAVPELLTRERYPLVFAVLAAAASAGVVLMVERLSGRGSWLLFWLAVGAFGTLFFRYDIFVVALTVSAFLAARRHQWRLAQAVLALAVALKLYPVVLMPLVVLWEYREERSAAWRSATAGASALLAVACGMWIWAPEQIRGMLRYHHDRPLEFESVGANVAWMLGGRAAEFSFGSWNLRSPGEYLFIPVMTLLAVGLLLATYAMFAAGRLTPARAWALALVALLTTSKVFSAQYLIWFLPFIALIEVNTGAESNGRRWVAGAGFYYALWVMICATTSAIYPIALERFAMPKLIAGHVPGLLMALVTTRNVLLIAAGVMLLDRRSFAEAELHNRGSA